jgi:phosphoglycerate dehydrogenase-like enzyme
VYGVVMNFLYVAEPAVIDIDKIRELLNDTDYEIIAGDASFSNADIRAYDTLIIRSQTLVDDHIKNHFPSLQNIVRIGTGLDNVDVDFCTVSDIKVFNAAGANADAVSDYTITMLLFVLRKLHLLQEQDVREWNRFKFVGDSMTDQTVGIIGFGNIGKGVYRKLRALGCTKFFAYDPYAPENSDFQDVQFSSLDKILESSSIVTIHAALTAETKNLINSTNIGLLAEDSILLNAARGELVDENSVLTELEHKKFTYITDTVVGEPVINPKLLGNENVIVTPHIASLTKQSEKQMLETAINNLINGKSYN